MILPKQELEKQLEALVVKWRGKVPKSDMDRGWWKFKCDKTLATRLRDQILYYDKYVEREKIILAAELAEKEENDKIIAIFS